MKNLIDDNDKLPGLEKEEKPVIEIKNEPPVIDKTKEQENVPAKKDNTQTIIIIVLFVAALIAFFLYSYMNKKDEQNGTN